MRVNLDQWVARAGALAPSQLLRPLLRVALGGHNVALCVHRVSEPSSPPAREPDLTVEAGELDRLIELLLSARPGSRERWLSATFDDGYQDAARYVQSRARRFPTVEFLFFVCPEKAEHGAGFRWDLPRQPTAGEPADVEGENQRDDLRALEGHDRFRLAGLPLLDALRALPNVALGNHTNGHFRAAALDPEQSLREFARSQADFERLFGKQTQFAFPFGTPQHDFHAGHVGQLRRLSQALLWTTEPRPYQVAERVPGAVLPRYPVRGPWGHRGVAAWIAARAAYARWRGPRHLYP